MVASGFLFPTCTIPTVQRNGPELGRRLQSPAGRSEGPRNAELGREAGGLRLEPARAVPCHLAFPLGMCRTPSPVTTLLPDQPQPSCRPREASAVQLSAPSQG